MASKSNENKIEKMTVNVAVLNEKVDEINRHLTNIEDNHLTFIYNRLNSVEKKQAYYAGGLAILVLVISILLKIIK